MLQQRWQREDAVHDNQKLENLTGFEGEERAATWLRLLCIQNCMDDDGDISHLAETFASAHRPDSAVQDFFAPGELFHMCEKGAVAKTAECSRRVFVPILFLYSTSIVQPHEAEIIAWVKKDYRRRVLLRIFQNIEAGRKSVYNVDILTTM